MCAAYFNKTNHQTNPCEAESKVFPCDVKTYENLPGEIWKEIPGTDGYYEISNLGRVRSLDRTIITKTGKVYFRKGVLLKQIVLKYHNRTINDYVKELVCTVSWQGTKNRFAVHRMVYEIFHSPLDFDKDKLVVLHKDGDYRNNLPDNLYATTVSEKAKRIYSLKRGHKISSFITAATKQLGIERRYKQVSQYNLTGEKIGLYTNIKTAEAKTGVNGSSIVAACKRKKMVSAGGFIWQYGNGELTIDTQFYHRFLESGKKNVHQPVTKFSVTGKCLQRYKSIKEAAAHNKLSRESIGVCINGKVTTCGGFLWRAGSITKDIDVTPIAESIQKSIGSQERPVMQICPVTRKVLTIYPSIAVAAKANDIKARSDIRRAAKLRNALCKGYQWRFAS